MRSGHRGRVCAAAETFGRQVGAEPEATCSRLVNQVVVQSLWRHFRLPESRAATATNVKSQLSARGVAAPNVCSSRQTHNVSL